MTHDLAAPLARSSDERAARPYQLLHFSISAFQFFSFSSPISPSVQLQLLVLIFAATTILGRLSTVSASVLVSWRCALATVGAALWVLLIRRKPLWPGNGAALKLMGVGVLIGLHWLCLFGAVKVANVSIALAGLATLSLFTAFTEPLILRWRIRRYEVALGLVVLVGIVLIAGAERAHLSGLSLALASALLAAIFMVINKRLVVSGAEPMVMVAWEMLAACGVCLLAVPLLDAQGIAALLVSDPLDWLWISLLAFGCTVYAQELANRLLRVMSAYKFNLAANFEPVYGFAAAALIFHEFEELRPTFYVGALLIVVANFVYPRMGKAES